MTTQRVTIDTVQWFGTKSHTRRDVRLTVFGTTDVLTLPLEVTTKVLEVKQLLAQRLGAEPEKMSFVVKHSSSYRMLRETDEMRSDVVVKGIKNWVREKAKYPHPICIIGAGHWGLRQAMSFLKEGIKDFTIYDRWSRVGGTAWVKNANPTSKLQTELGVYHLQYDKDYPIPRETMKTWPTRDELLDHFHEVSVEYGILAHTQLNTSVTEVRVVINQRDAPFYFPDKQHFEVVSRRADIEDGDEVEVTYSAIAYYPGALTMPLRVELKGEDVFEGPIGYGMFDEFDYAQVKDSTPAVFGAGAFGVENVRTCLESGANKVWMICRRKNVFMPRVVSWFINQSLFPVPGAMMMEAMLPMYDMIPDDPWSYYSVVANKDRTTCTIRQKSRFGVGDMFFLACHYKKCEVVVDDIKRLKPFQVVLESGNTIKVDSIIKVLGFRADMAVDKMMGVKEMVGYFANGDWRRWICTETHGVDAGRFGGTSLSPAALQTTEAYSWFVNYPKDLGPVFESGMLPRRKADKDKEMPAYAWDPRNGASISMILSSGIIPGLAEIASIYGLLNRAKQLEAHPLEQFVDECAAEWFEYGKLLKDPNSDEPIPPYPYTHDLVRKFVERNDREGEEEMLRQARRSG